MSSAMVSAFYDGSNDVFGSYSPRSPEPFSPTNTFQMTFDHQQRLGSFGVDDLEGFKRQASVPNLLMRSLSLSCKPADLPSFGSDSVFTSNNIFDNSKERMRDRAFSESDRNLRNNGQQCQQQQQPQQNSNRYKTELCRPFMENGKCKYGDKCQFAHGGHEIRNLQRHPKYKTELCRTYHTVGICPYGPRCHFIHNPVERKSYATSPKQRRERTIERPKLLPFNSMPLGSTGDLTPPPSVSDSPYSPFAFPDTEDHLLEVLKAKAKELATGEQLDLLMSPRGMSPTLQSPITSAPPSPFIPGGPSFIDVQLKDNVFFSSGPSSKPPSPVSYRPPSPPDSDPETYSDRSTSPPGTTGRRLPIFRVMSMEEYR